tara:strand:- start:3962 stop:8461 length:4500 start_codon:yes stop_codon:yes gene_type:complete
VGIRKPSEYFDREKASVENSIRESSKNPELNTVSDAYNTFKRNLSKVDLLTDFSETLENYQLNIEKVNHLSTKIDEIDEDIKTLLTKEDLDKALISQLLFLEECIHDVQEKVKNINHKNLAQVKSDVSSLSETVNFFIDEEIPKYKKYVFESEFRLTNKYEALSEEVEETLSNAKEFVDEKYNQDFNNINEKINIINQKINNIKTDDILTYKNLIAGSEIKTESKIKEFAESLNNNVNDVATSLNNTVNDIVSKIELVKEDNTEIFDTLNSKVNQVNQIHNLIIEDIEKNETTRDELDKKIVDLKVEILRNESHIKNQNKNIETIHEDVKSAISKLNIDEIEQNNFKLARKIKYFEEVFEKFNEKEILNENIITEPSSTNNDDPLTPLDNNFVTLDQLQNHYRLFINRIQQQLAIIGGGGETRLEFLDDVDRDTAKSNGKFLKYDESLDKWVGADVGGINTTTTLLTGDVNVGGAITVAGNSRFNGNVDIIGTLTYEDLNFTGSIDVDGHTELDNLNVSGLSTFVGTLDANGNVDVAGTLDVDGHTELDDVNVSGIITASRFVGELGVLGNTYYVATTGSDSNAGDNINESYLTIAQALSVATNGDVINVSAGIFEETCPLTVPRGVTIKGAGLRATTIRPTTATNKENVFLLNDISTLEDFTIKGSYYDSNVDTGYAFSYATGIAITSRSPYIQRITVLNTGTTVTADDPYGYDTADSPPTSYLAGRGAKVDGSLVDSSSLEAGMLFNEVTFFTPNNKGIILTNGARAEYLNCFHYFASEAITGESGSVGIGSTAGSRLNVVGVTTTLSANDVVKQFDGGGNVVAIGTVKTFDSPYIVLTDKGSGIFTSIGAGSTNDVRFFDSDGTTQRGSADRVAFADYTMFGAELRSVGCAVEYGSKGVIADGDGVNLRLFALNFNHVGSGKDFSNDPTKSIQANETTQLNNGEVSYVSIDHKGDFRVGESFYVNQETGSVSFAATSVNLEVTGNMDVTDGVDTSTLTPTSLSVGNLQLAANTFSSVAGDIVIDPSGSNKTIVQGDLGVVGVLTASVINVGAFQQGNSSVSITDTGSNGTIIFNTDNTEAFRVNNIQQAIFAGDVVSNGNLNVVGVSTFASIDVTGLSALNEVTVGSALTVTGLLDSNGGLDVTGHTELDDLNVSGVSTFAAVDLSNAVATGIITAASFNGYDYLQAPHGSTVNYSVTVASKTSAHRYDGTGSLNGYVINGVESPFLTFTPGRTYRFTLSSSDMSSHPFRFYLEADKTTAYTTNVTSTATYTEIVVTDTTPTVLHYQCSSHGYMGNAVQVNSNKVNTPYQIDGLKGANITGVITATSFIGSGSGLTGLTGASAATYGSAGATPVIVVDSDGRITGISTVATSGGGGGGGSVSEAFKTISVSGQSDVVADDATDTLTLVAGSNMTITTNASGDSITFASSGGGGGGGSSGVEIKNNGTSVGTGITAIDFSTNVTATASSGVATVTASGGGGGGVTTGKAIAMAIVFG